jgi:hypothetical protein
MRTYHFLSAKIKAVSVKMKIYFLFYIVTKLVSTMAIASAFNNLIGSRNLFFALLTDLV